MPKFSKNCLITEDFYLFYPRNIKFLEGSTRWTEQGKHRVFELVMSIPLFILLIVFLVYWDFELWLKILLLVIFGGISLGLVFWFYRKLQRERYLSHSGQIITGVITDCSLTNKGSDTDIFEIEYAFDNNQFSFETHLDRERAENLVGKKVLVLYSNKDNFLVL